MGGGGGATSTSETTITFEDKSDYIYRNSATKRGGFEGSTGFVSNNTDLDIGGNEDITKLGVLLNAADRDAIRAQIGTLNDCVIANFCQERADLHTRATKAWDRACTLYADTKGEIQAELDDLKAEMINMICLNTTQWARTAGSSLNCTVQGMKTEAEIALTRRIAGVLSERLLGLKQQETNAIAQAFTDSLNARMEPSKLAMAHMGTMYGLLRGAEVTDTTSRTYTEGRDEDSRQFTLMGKFFHDVTDVADNSGTYSAELDDAYAASTAVAGVVPSA